MGDYISAVLYRKMGDNEWGVDHGSHEELVARLNAILEAQGKPTRSRLVEARHSDVFWARWSDTSKVQEVRYVMNRVPGYTPVWCPTCRTEMKPPIWDGQDCHGWHAEWTLNDEKLYECKKLVKEEPNGTPQSQPAAV